MHLRESESDPLPLPWPWLLPWIGRRSGTFVTETAVSATPPGRSGMFTVTSCGRAVKR